MAAPASVHRAIHVFNRQRALPVDLAWLRRFAAAALAEIGKDIHPATPLAALEEIEVSIVSDRVIARVHRDFMDIPGATDVITFEHGEIVISSQTADRYAREFKQPLPHELGLYIIHGILHLNGYDDLSEPAASIMKKEQAALLRRTLDALER